MSADRLLPSWLPSHSRTSGESSLVIGSPISTCSNTKGNTRGRNDSPPWRAHSLPAVSFATTPDRHYRFAQCGTAHVRTSLTPIETATYPTVLCSVHPVAVRNLPCLKTFYYRDDLERTDLQTLCRGVLHCESAWQSSIERPLQCGDSITFFGLSYSRSGAEPPAGPRRCTLYRYMLQVNASRCHRQRMTASHALMEAYLGAALPCSVPR